MKNRLILFSFVILLVISSFVLAEETAQSPQQEMTIIKTQQNMQQAIDENARTVTYTFSSADSAIEVQRKSYWNVVPSSENNQAYVKTDDKGNLIEADLTASKETSWTFGQETLKVPEGARVVFKDGKIEVIGKENQQIGLTDKTSGTELKSSLTLGKDSVSIENGIISGKDFQVEDIKVQQGSLSVVNGGYVLGENSLADWKGLTLGNEKDLFLATSETAYNSYEGSALFPEDLRLRGKGEGFDVLFNEGNNWAKIDSKDNFGIKAVKDFEFSLENRDTQGKIPLMNTKGEFMINEDSKSLYTENGKVLIKKDGTLFGQNQKDSSTSPIELFVEGQNSKYLVNNFKGIATLSNLDATEGKIDERYANSIYFKRASVENQYNYPTEKNLLKNYGLNIVWDNTLNLDDQAKTQILRELADYSETFPKEFNQLNPLNIKIASRDARGSSYNWEDNSVNLVLKDGNLWGIDENIGAIGTLRHELGHLYQDSLYGNSLTQSNLNQLGISGEAYNKIVINTPFSQEWLKINGISSISDLNKNYQNLIEIKKRGIGDSFTTERVWVKSNNCDSETGPCKGYVKPYGVSFKEDMSTYIEKVVGDPAFFKRNSLIGENADPRYAQKLELLKNYGFISPQEYDSVLHPEKYGL